MTEFKYTDCYQNGDICKMIYNLKKNYGFYMPTNTIWIKNQNIIEFADNQYKKHKHYIGFYQIKDSFKYYIIIYKKNTYDIYYCNELNSEYYEKGYSKNKRLKDNIFKAYKKAEKSLEQEQEQYNEQDFTLLRDKPDII